MLRWRIPLGILMTGVLVGLFWLDHYAGVPGLWLFPVTAVLIVMAGREVLQLAAVAGVRPLG